MHKPLLFAFCLSYLLFWIPQTVAQQQLHPAPELFYNQQPTLAHQQFSALSADTLLQLAPAQALEQLALAQHYAALLYDTEALKRNQQLLAHWSDTELSPTAEIEYLLATLEYQLYFRQMNNAFTAADRLNSLLLQSNDANTLFRGNMLLGKQYQLDNQMEKALQFYQLAMQHNRASPPALQSLRDNWIRLQIARINIVQYNNQQAANLLQQIITTTEPAQSVLLATHARISLGYVYSLLQPHSAKPLYQQAIEMSPSAQLALMAKNNLVSLLIELEDYPAAQDMAEEALQQVGTGDDIRYYLNFNLAYARLMQGDSTQIHQLEQAVRQVEALGNKLILDTGLNWLGRAYETLGDYPKLAATLKERLAIRDTIQTEQREKLIGDLNTRFELQNQQQLIQNLANENALQTALLRTKRLELTVTLVVITLILLVLVITLMLYKKVRGANAQLNQLNVRLAFESNHDSMTGLLNRRAIQQWLSQLSRDTALQPFGLLILDIDFFKQINDHLGHAAGDEVLIELAKRLKVVFGNQALISRWGGEEFLILFDKHALPQHLQRCQHLLQQLAEQPIALQQQSIRVTLSGGFIQLPFSCAEPFAKDWEYLLQIADMALYYSKVHGRNQIGLVSSVSQLTSEQTQRVNQDFSAALDQQLIQLQVIHGVSLQADDPLLTYRLK